ncbi:MAG: general secretion pathway protein GspB [Gammaproteobacteria bacterium]
MSLILDALRKSERTRQQSLTGRVSAADAPPAQAHIPIPWVTLIGLLIIVNAIVLAIIFWRSHDSGLVPAAPAIHTVPSIPSAVQPAPAYRPEIRSLAMEAAATNGTTADTVTTQPAMTQAKAASTKVISAATATTPIAPAIAPINNSNPSAGNPPPLDTLPLAFQQSLPPLHLDVHSYAQNPADRFVVINMQRYQAGDTLKEGPKVLEIVPDGVILEYNGQAFLLPRP